MRTALLILAVVAAALPGAASAQHGHEGHATAAAACAKPRSIDCAKVVTPAFAPDGALWLAWVKEGQVWVATSSDGGATLSEPIAVNSEKAAIDDNGQNRPKVLADGKGRVFVSYTTKGAKPYTGAVLFSRSTDGGRSFSAPRTIADDATSQRFDALGLAPSGRIYAAWIDKRGSAAAQTAGQHYVGAALAMAWSDDAGATFSKTIIAQDHSCECCRLGLAMDDQGLPTLMWRHVFGANIRDHAVMRFATPDTPGPLRRVADDAWAIDACPHHGPGLALANGTSHAVWYTQGAKRKGLFYARAVGDGAFSEPMPLGNAAETPGHATVAAVGATVAVAWKEFDGVRAAIRTITSVDGGASWTPPATAMTTEDASDLPLLVADGRGIYLSWVTRAEGWRFAPVAIEAVR